MFVFLDLAHLMNEGRRDFFFTVIKKPFLLFSDFSTTGQRRGRRRADKEARLLQAHLLV
jgi:hypothetical protein